MNDTHERWSVFVNGFHAGAVCGAAFVSIVFICLGVNFG